MTVAMAIAGIIIWASSGMPEGAGGLLGYALMGGAIGAFLRYFVVGSIFDMFH